MKKFFASLLLLTLLLTSCSVNAEPRVQVSDESSEALLQSLEDSSAESSPQSSGADSSGSESRSLSFPTAESGERLGLADIVEDIQNSVVAINVTGTASFYYYTYPTEGSGSGVIISDDGYIVTNNHVISGGNNITVFLHDGTTYPAKLVATDRVTDVAVLKIEANGLNYAQLGDSSTLRVGDFALAVGNPLGEFQGSVTLGIVSGLNREISLDNEKHTVFQVDAAINPGNSGGGMFDTNGRLIGIVTAKTVSKEVEGLGFVLPVNDVKPVVEDLINYGYVKGRPTLGFEPVEITSMRVANYYGLDKTGVFINEVSEGSYAEQCGLSPRDYIITADGERVATVERLYEILNGKKVGDTMVLEIQRGGTVLDVLLIIGEQKN